MPASASKLLPAKFYPQAKARNSARYRKNEVAMCLLA